MNKMGIEFGKQDKNGGGWTDGSTARMNLFCSFCERQFSTLTSYWCTTWVDNMNANKIRKKKHQYEKIDAGGFGRRIKLDLTEYVNKDTRGKRKEREREITLLSALVREETGFIIEGYHRSERKSVQW